MSKKIGPDFGDSPGPALNSARWRFGEFELDEGLRELRLRGELLLVEPKPLNLLMLMLRHPGELITKNDLIDALWTGRIVTDGVLASCVGKLRQVVESDPSITIKTIHGYGYRFDGPAALLEDQDSGVAAPKLNLSPGQSIAQRPNWQLVRRLGRSGDSWLAEHVKTRARRVFKFTTDPHGLSALKREVTIFRLLRESLGDRICYVDLLDWNFDEPPWFVETEYCSGGSLQEWFEVQGGVAKVPLATRLDLIAQIADALADVHIIGVLHKDLKPANVFVVPGADAAPRIRLADFGSGRLLDAGRLAALQITNMGFTQVIDTDTTSGTPLYLAPEVLAGHPATVKADIYALGVMLYQCVVGNLRRPLAAGWEQEVSDEMLREDIAIAAEGNPERRLANAAELARNLRSIESRRVEREAEREAQAKADRASRALERMRARRVGLIAAFAALTIGFIVSAMLYLDARKARGVAEAETGRAEKVAAFLGEDMFKAVNTQDHPVRDLTVEQLLDGAAAQVEKRFEGEPRIAAQVYASLGRSYQSLELTDGSRIALRKALDLYQQIDPGSKETAEVARDLIFEEFIKGELGDKIGQYIAIEKAARARLGEDSMMAASLAVNIARAQRQLGDWQGGDERLAEVFERLRVQPARDPALYIVVELALAVSLADSGRYKEAEHHLLAAIDRITALRGARHLDVSRARTQLGYVYAMTGRFAEAGAQLTTALAIAHEWVREGDSYVIGNQLYRAYLNYEQGDYGGAVRILEPLLANYEAGAEGLLNQSYVHREPLARTYQAMGRLTDAERMMRTALAGAVGGLGSRHPYAQSIRIGLADILREQGRANEAWDMLKAEPQLGSAGLPVDNPKRAELERVRGLLYREAGDVGNARLALAESLRITETEFGAGHRNTQRVRRELDTLGAAKNRAAIETHTTVAKPEKTAWPN